MIKLLRWIFGKKYFIIKTNDYLEDEIVVFWHKIYIGTRRKEKK